MSRRGREGAPGDEQLLAALDRLVEVEGIVKAGKRYGISQSKVVVSAGCGVSTSSSASSS